MSDRQSVDGPAYSTDITSSPTPHLTPEGAMGLGGGGVREGVKRQAQERIPGTVAIPDLDPCAARPGTNPGMVAPPAAIGPRT